MPEEAYWETLFDVPLVLDRLGVDARLRDVIEFGCGYGTFTIPVAKRISGTLITFDIDEAMVERTRQRAAAAGTYNVVYVVGDVFADGFGGVDGSKDACLLFNILHCEEPVELLAEAARVVRPGGVVLVTHWRYDAATPRGPSMEIRPRPEQIIEWAAETGLLEAVGPVIDLLPWHYGLRLRRRGAPEARPTCVLANRNITPPSFLRSSSVPPPLFLRVSYGGTTEIPRRYDEGTI